MQPFSITLFATTGDPEGIRHLDKSNWSGYGVVFNRELFHLLKLEPGFSQAGTAASSSTRRGGDEQTEQRQYVECDLVRRGKFRQHRGPNPTIPCPGQVEG